MKALPEPRILELGEDFYTPVTAATFAKSFLRFKNTQWAQTLDLKIILNLWIGYDIFANLNPSIIIFLLLWL